MGQDGFSSAGIMRKDLYTDMFQKENCHWWHQGKRWMLHRVIQSRVAVSAKPALVIDLGCGTGAFIQEVSCYAKGIGVDAESEALEFCRQRGLDRLCMADLGTRHLPFSDGSVDIVVLADCLEHVRSDVALLKEAERILVKGGTLVIMVPAYRWLWSYWDVVSGHQRRYTWASLRRVIADAGLAVQHHTYVLMGLLPLAVLWRMIRHLRFGQDPEKSGSEFVVLPDSLNRFLLQLYCLEGRVADSVSLPFGLSLLAVCSKS